MRPAGLFTRDAATIARVMATQRVSPKGIGLAIRMVQFLENAKSLLQKRRHPQARSH